MSFFIEQALYWQLRQCTVVVYVRIMQISVFLHITHTHLVMDCSHYTEDVLMPAVSLATPTAS